MQESFDFLQTLSSAVILSKKDTLYGKREFLTKTQKQDIYRGLYMCSSMVRK
jgi:hypothetical protein